METSLKKHDSAAITRSIVLYLASLLYGLFAPFAACHAADEKANAESSHKKNLPKWEAGAGLSALTLPDYIGSEDSAQYLLPIPYFVYRGERLRVERESARSRLMATDTLQLDLSFSGSLPVNSQDNEARQGMPDLDAIGEVGPALRYTLFRDALQNRRLSIEVPVRAAIATDARHYEHVGWTANIHLVYKQTLGGWRTSYTLSALFADDRYHNYIYGVEDRYARALRPAFDAGDGFTAWRFSAGIGKRRANMWYGAFLRYHNLEGSAVEDSPLVTSRHSLSAGIAVAWVWRESKLPAGN